jgi:hypothetical protein
MYRVGYHRVSDDSITSALLSDNEMICRLHELAADNDVDTYWVRDDETKEVLFMVPVTI